MKKIESKWLKLILSGTVLIIIYKLLDKLPEIKNFCGNLLSILFPCILGAVIAFFLFVPTRKLENLLKKTKFKWVQKHSRAIAVLLLYLLIFVVIALCIVYLLPRLYKNIEELVSNLPRYFNVAEDFFANNRIFSMFDIDIWKTAETELSGHLQMSEINKYIGIIGSVANSFISVFVGIVISIYVIIDKENIMKYIRKVRRGLFGSRFAAVTFYVKKSTTLFYSYFTGLLTDAVIVGIVCAIGLSVLKVPYSVLLGVVTILSNMIPFFGPFISTLIIGIISLISGGIWRLIPVLIFLAVMYIADSYFIQPKVISKSTGVRPLLVLVSVIVFGDLFGVIGMVLSVPLAATLKLILDDYVDDRKINGRLSE